MRVVLFDLDGTLIDTGALYAECYRRAFAAELEEPPSLVELAQHRPASERHFLLDWFGHEVGHKIHVRMCEAYEELAADLFGGWFGGVGAMLEELRERDVKMGIVTGKSRRAYDVTRRHLPLDELFDVIVLEDDVPLPKPDPSGLYRALHALGATASEAVYVGDSPSDVEAAQRASMRGASALWARPPHEHDRIAQKLEPAVWALRTPAELARRIAW